MNTTRIRITGENDYFITEAINVLRTNIQFSGQDVKTIVMTSCVANEGKTVVSLHIAKSLAELGKRVLLIDADMRKSVMAGRNADAKGAKGLSEVLTGQFELTESIYATQYENLHLLFAGQFPPSPVDLLNGKYFEDLIDAVKTMYDYVIIDTPPLGIVIDAAVIAARCDSSIVIIGNDKVKYRRAQDVVDKLRKAGTKVLGVVMNQATEKHSAYYYSNDKYYSYKSKY